MFKFNYSRFHEMPKLGWTMHIKKNTSEVQINVGDYVDTFDDWFVSGVWDGPFTEANFEAAQFLCATAIKKEEDHITVYSPTHERQRFCYIKYEDEIIFSNSIPLLLAVSGESADVSCDQYEKFLCAILSGTKKYEQQIPIANGKVIHQIFCADITVDGEIDLNYRHKPKHRDFVDFDDYYNTLIQMCERVRDNGLDANRRHKFTLATTASSGYDSSTCAAIARKVGCDTLFTFKGGKYDEDSAVDIGKQLGYENIIERGHIDFKSKTECIDAEYFVCGDIGDYLQFSAFEDDFAGRIVFSGTSGSYIWDKDSDVNEDSVRHHYNYYTANLSFAENAIVKGYVFFPLALYGSSAVESIQKITNASEMKPWTLNTSYDRPICRRILETSGVRRESFGQVKYGGGFSLSRNFTKKQIQAKMSEEGYAAFCQWLSIKGNNVWTLGRCWRMIQYHFCCIPDYAAYFLRKCGIDVKSEVVVVYPNPGLPAKLIVWGMDVMTKKYRSAMR